MGVDQAVDGALRRTMDMQYPWPVTAYETVYDAIDRSANDAAIAVFHDEMGSMEHDIFRVYSHAFFREERHAS